jgi:hypothetical protein
MLIYVAGPMTGLPDFNYPAFRAAAAELREAGFDVEDPSTNENPTPGDYHGWLCSTDGKRRAVLASR